MADEEQSLSQLREKFVRNSGKRLEDLTRFVELLVSDASDTAVLDQAMRRFHSLAGLGTTFGFPRVTALSRAVEIESQQLLADGHLPTPETLARWRMAIDSLRHAFREGTELTATIEEEPEASPQLSPHDVLLLEDDPLGHKLLVRILERQNMTVRGAFTKADAMRLVAEKMPDAVVSDVLVPDGTGYELIEHIRSLPGGDLIPAVITSGLQGFLDKVEAVRCGADSFFEKPIDFASLVRTLENLLDRTKLEGPRILYVENGAEEAEFALSVLESAGYQVRVCNDPRHFESDLSAFRPDLVLMNVALPGVSGFEMTQYVRQKQGFTMTPVVLLTREDDLDGRVESVRAGADDALTVPVPPRLLIATVDSRIERARYVRNLLEHDGLTGLLTHTAFMRQLKNVFDERARHPLRLPTLILGDIDHFKLVNDTHGHPVGDRVLASLGSLLRKRLRRSDLVARYGGEEFAMLLPDLSAPESIRLVDRIREEFGSIEHQNDRGERFFVTFSAGVAGLTEETRSVEQWKIAADTALYGAKGAGRNRVL